MGERRRACRILVRDLRETDTWKTQTWKGDVKMVAQDVGWRGIDWIDLAQDRDSWRAPVNAIIDLRVPINAGNFLTRLTSGEGLCSMRLRWVETYNLEKVALSCHFGILCKVSAIRASTFRRGNGKIHGRSRPSVPKKNKV